MKLNFRDWLEVYYMDIGHDKFRDRDSDVEEYMWVWEPKEGLQVKQTEYNTVHYNTWNMTNILAKGRVGGNQGSIGFTSRINNKQQKRVINLLLKKFPGVESWWVWDKYVDGMPLAQWWQQAA